MGGTSEQQPANQRLPDYRRAKNLDEPATDINTAVGCWNRPLPAAAASGMIATQDVLHLLWEMEQRRFISGFLSAMNLSPATCWLGKEIPSPMHSVTTEGFGVKRCWQIPENWGGRSQYQLG